MGSYGDDFASESGINDLPMVVLGASALVVCAAIQAGQRVLSVAGLELLIACLA